MLAYVHLGAHIRAVIYMKTSQNKKMVTYIHLGAHIRARITKRKHTHTHTPHEDHTHTHTPPNPYSVHRNFTAFLEKTRFQVCF